MTNATKKTSIYHYLLLSLGILLLVLIGFGGFIGYLERAQSGFAGMGLWLLAIMAGIASLFSPCSFPLLLTVLGREAGSRRRLWQAAGAFAVGATLFLMLLGLLLALGAGSWVATVTFTSVAGRWLRTAVGLLLISFGMWQVRGQSLNFHWLNRAMQPLWTMQARLRHQQTALSYSLYGFGYILAGFG